MNKQLGYLCAVNIFLTYDYELFFGSHSGSVEKCLLEPTQSLFELADGKDVFLTFFVDVGYLIAAEKYGELKDDIERVKQQISEMVQRGHDVQLHIHPHWERASYENGKWKMNTRNAYKLSDFQEEERKSIVVRYKTYLENIIGKKVEAFRAGGWCIQPFDMVSDVFKEVGIKADSSVIAGEYLMTDDYDVDFTQAPFKSKYRFEEDVCIENPEGYFTEYPIASLRYSPLFFWRLYLLGRFFPQQHKMIGDGRYLDQGGRKKRVLTMYTNGHVSTDGYYARKLNAALSKAKNLGYEEMVVIGHPKGNTLYSLERLKEFIARHHKNHNFTTFERVL